MKPKKKKSWYILLSASWCSKRFKKGPFCRLRTLQTADDLINYGYCSSNAPMVVYPHLIQLIRHPQHPQVKIKISEGCRSPKYGTPLSRSFPSNSLGRLECTWSKTACRTTARCPLELLSLKERELGIIRQKGVKIEMERMDFFVGNVMALEQRDIMANKVAPRKQDDAEGWHDIGGARMEAICLKYRGIAYTRGWFVEKGDMILYRFVTALRMAYFVMEVTL